MSALAQVRAVLNRQSAVPLVLGWLVFAALLVAQPLEREPIPTGGLFALLAGLIAVIVVCAFGVVAQAEHLARRLGDPYGTLVLTLSIVIIEVILISSVMLGPGEHATIARDSVMAVSMIILNLVVGVALLVGGRQHRMVPNRAGVSAYTSLLVVLLATAFAFPAVIGDGGAYLPGQAIPIALLTVGLYAFFLYRQMGPQRGDFQEVGATTPAGEAPRATIGAVMAEHRTEVLARGAILVLTVVPIVLLSHVMASLLDDGLGRIGAPVALSGLLIAMIVFLPETLTTIRAAAGGEIQRVSNLCHGALVSTVGLTIPAVLIIGLLTGQRVVLGEGPAHLTLLGITMLLTVTSFFGKRVTSLHGGAHLMLFALYVLIVFV